MIEYNMSEQTRSTELSLCGKRASWMYFIAKFVSITACFTVKILSTFRLLLIIVMSLYSSKDKGTYLLLQVSVRNLKKVKSNLSDFQNLGGGGRGVLGFWFWSFLRSVLSTAVLGFPFYYIRSSVSSTTLTLIGVVKTSFDAPSLKL